uniref:LRR-RLK n=1 Tax=Rhizophora mucronata TaxID=61149 RepID=A0A2P2MMA0_RHIMU
MTQQSTRFNWISKHKLSLKVKKSSFFQMLIKCKFQFKIYEKKLTCVCLVFKFNQSLKYITQEKKTCFKCRLQGNYGHKHQCGDFMSLVVTFE